MALNCKIYDVQGNEMVSAPIFHFSERVRLDGKLELSCAFRVPAGEIATAIDAYKGLMNRLLSKVAIYKDETLVVVYEKYNAVTNVQIDYGSFECTGAILFGEGIDA